MQNDEVFGLATMAVMATGGAMLLIYVVRFMTF